MSGMSDCEYGDRECLNACQCGCESGKFECWCEGEDE